MKRFRRIAVLLFTVTVCCANFSSGTADRSETAERAAGQEKTAEQAYRNIQILKGLPASQLPNVMAVMTGSLGVRCNHCHGQPFEKDDKPAKQTARRMIQMVFDLNKGNFGGRDAVTCYTCHRGQLKPVAAPAVGQNLWQKSNPAGAKADAPLPTVDQVLDKYAQAIGGREALAKLTTRMMKGSRVGADGVLVPEEVYQKAPDKVLIVTVYPNITFRVGFNGLLGWARDSAGGSEIGKEMLAELGREAKFYKDINLRELYSQMTIVGKATVGDRKAYVIEATPPTGGPEKLFFDIQTGLLIRRYMESKTVLGPSPFQTDYEDYQEVDGVKLPFTIRWSIPGRVWGRKITEVKHNLPIEDAKFNPPAARSG